MVQKWGTGISDFKRTFNHAHISLRSGDILDDFQMWVYSPAFLGDFIREKLLFLHKKKTLAPSPKLTEEKVKNVRMYVHFPAYIESSAYDK